MATKLSGRRGERPDEEGLSYPTDHKDDLTTGVDELPYISSLDSPLLRDG